MTDVSFASHRGSGGRGEGEGHPSLVRYTSKLGAQTDQSFNISYDALNFTDFRLKIPPVPPQAHVILPVTGATCLLGDAFATIVVLIVTVAMAAAKIHKRSLAGSLALTSRRRRWARKVQCTGLVLLLDPMQGTVRFTEPVIRSPPLLLLCTPPSIDDRDSRCPRWVHSFELFLAEADLCRAWAVAALVTANNARVLRGSVDRTIETLGLTLELAVGGDSCGNSRSTGKTTGHARLVGSFTHAVSQPSAYRLSTASAIAAANSAGVLRKFPVNRAGATGMKMTVDVVMGATFLKPAASAASMAAAGCMTPVSNLYHPFRYYASRRSNCVTNVGSYSAKSAPVATSPGVSVSRASPADGTVTSFISQETLPPPPPATHRTRETSDSDPTGKKSSARPQVLAAENRQRYMRGISLLSGRVISRASVFSTSKQDPAETRCRQQDETSVLFRCRNDGGDDNVCDGAMGLISLTISARGRWLSRGSPRGRRSPSLCTLASHPESSVALKEAGASMLAKLRGASAKKEIESKGHKSRFDRLRARKGFNAHAADTAESGTKSRAEEPAAGNGMSSEHGSGGSRGQRLRGCLKGDSELGLKSDALGKELKVRFNSTIDVSGITSEGKKQLVVQRWEKNVRLSETDQHRADRQAKERQRRAARWLNQSKARENSGAASKSPDEAVQI